MIHLREQYWAVEVPSMAFGFDVNNYGDESEYMYMLDIEDITDEPDSDETLITKKLPPGTWEIVCTSNAVLEEQAASIVQIISNGKISGRPQYRRYDRDPAKDMPARSWTRDARHALETLLTSKGCDLNKNYLILKKTDKK
jgi:hypothetical protein